jgi:uncharacterized protein
MNPFDIIDKYYGPHPSAGRLLIKHSRLVADKALQVAERLPHLVPDLGFIEEAALLHDIGIIFTEAPALDCHGRHPYVCHGILGRELLEEEGLGRHALVCERHVGVGISPDDIRTQGLPLPVRDMQPVSIEEQIIGYADKFYSKKGNGAGHEKTIAEIMENLAPYGKDKVGRFRTWVKMFEGRDRPTHRQSS